MNTKEVKVLMLSTDPHAFVEGSPVQKRFLSYGAELGELHVLVIGTHHEPVSLSEKVTIHSTGSKSKVFGLFSGVHTGKRLVKKFGIDVVSAQDPFEIGWVALQITDATPAQLHVQVHTDMLSPWFVRDSLKNKIRVRIADVVLRNAKGIRVVSERVKKSIVTKYGDRVVEPTVLPIMSSLRTGVAKEKPFPFTILSIGRLTREKHLAIALKVLHEVHKSSKAVGLVFVGTGPEQGSLERYAKSIGVFEKVQFVGWSDTPADWFRTADCLLHTSAYEGYGMVFIEAALNDLPIVSTDVGIMGEVFVSSQDALVCPVDDIACLSESVRKVLNDTYVREEMPRFARRKAKAHVALYEGYAKKIAENLTL